MRTTTWLLSSILLITSGRVMAKTLDLCPVYGPTHDAAVLPKLRSGIPFRLLSIAVAADGTLLRHVIRLEYDLWTETVTIDTLGKGTLHAPVAQSAAPICQALSFPDAPPGKAYDVRVLLNPLLGDRLQRLRSGELGNGLLQVNWDRLVRELESEKVLMTAELST